MKRVKNPIGLLPKRPQNGERITVLYFTTFVTARVLSASGGRMIKWRGMKHGRTLTRVSGDVRRRDEGTTWVRGWDTLAANAFVVAKALT
jgi:hypothetical protein